MSQVDVLIGHRMELYGEVLSAMLHARRPELVVRAVTPADLDETVRTLRPQVVICSAVTETIDDCSPAWISLYPDETDEAIISVAGVHRTIPHATVNQLLDVVGDVLASGSGPG